MKAERRNRTKAQTWVAVERLAKIEARKAEDFAAKRQVAEAQRSRGRVLGALLALSVADKARRGWYRYDEVAEELWYLSDMYYRHFDSGQSPRDHDLVAKAEVLAWTAELAARAFGGRQVLSGSRHAA